MADEIRLTEEQVKGERARMHAPALYTRYVGVLRVLCDASVYVTDDVRDMILAATEDAQANHHRLVFKQVLDRVDMGLRQDDGSVEWF